MNVSFRTGKFFVAFLFALGGLLPTSHAQKTEVKYLSGTGADDAVTWKFKCSEGRKSGVWGEIPVPSCWELHGYGRYDYGHVPFDKRGKEVGFYKHAFEAPKAWRGKAVEIVFEGAMTDAIVKINGKSAGAMHQGAFYQFRYDISSLLKYGRSNVLEVEVRKHSGNHSVNLAERKADYWIFGGIIRPVYLEVKPKSHIARVAIDAKADGSLRTVAYSSNTVAGDSLEVEVLNMKHHRLAMKRVAVKDTASFLIKDIQPWTPESPNRYQIRFALLNRKGEVQHEYYQKFGFRTVEVRERDGIYVNGVKIKFKGVNRHSFRPKTGRTLSHKDNLDDVLLIKSMNMNAVRMSHYPPDSYFLDVCDSLGLFVLNEVTGWQDAYDTVVGTKLVAELVKRDQNHPSVVLWDNGNEGGWNYGIDDEYAKWDLQQREVIHPWQSFRKTNTFHYISYDYLVHHDVARDKIFFPTEFLHGLYDGGHGAGLDDYWRLMWDNPLCASGFLWVLADEAVVRTDWDGKLDPDGNHAPDGIVGPYHEKEGSYYTIKEIWSPVYFEKRIITPEFDGVFNIENRYHYTSLSEVTFEAKWLKAATPYVPQEVLVAGQRIESPKLLPGQKGQLKVKLPYHREKADVLSITATDKFGREIYTWRWSLKSPAALSQSFMPLEEQGDKVVANVAEQEITVEDAAKAWRYTFSKKDGALSEVLIDGKEKTLPKGPYFVNDSTAVTEVVVEQKGKGYQIKVVFGKAKNSILWEVRPNGLLHLTAELHNPKERKTYEGITFTLPEEQVKGMNRLSDGPYRVWKNRHKGAEFGYYAMAYNNTSTGEKGYVYLEFKGFYANFYWTEVQMKEGLPFRVLSHTPNLYLRMLTPPKSEHPGRATEVKFPSGDLSFLTSIAPIGTKFLYPKELGPQSSPTTMYAHNAEPIQIKLTFDFMRVLK